MGKENKILQTDDSLDLAKEAFGFGEHQLLSEFHQAQQETISQDADRRIAGSEYQKILAKIESRAVKPDYAEGEGKKNTVRQVRRWKPLMMAAVLGVMLLGVATVTYGNRYYRYTAREVSGGKDLRLRNDGENLGYDNVIEAYKMMDDSLDITTLMLSYTPLDMKYVDLQLTGEFGKFKFTYKNNYVYFTEMAYNTEAVSVFLSDCENHEVVFNEWLNQEISIGRNKLDNGVIEYSASFGLDQGYYLMRGIMEKEQFIKIVEGINYFR